MKIGPKYKIARRFGSELFEKTRTARFAMVEGKKKANLQKRKKHRSSQTEYGTQFLEKQKLRYSYGITEKQLSNYVRKSRTSKKGTPAEETYRMLESRLDNVVYRLGLVPTRAFARQAVTHGHVTVNGKRVNIPSYQVKTGESIAIKDSSKEKGLVRGRKELLKDFNPPTWLALDHDSLTGKVVAVPKIGEYDSNLNFGVVVQFYSRV